MLETVFNSVAAFVSNLLTSILSFAKVLLRSRWGVQLPERQNARCSVLGNGPSLNDSLANHLDFLLETELIVVNGFAITEYFTRLRPANYIIADPNAFTFHDATTGREDLHQILKALITQVDWPMCLYIPNLAKGSYFIQQIEKGNPRIKLIYFNPTVIQGFQWFRYWLYDTNLGMLQAQTVIVAALFLMVNRKFDEIFLFGADTSWHEQIRISDTNQLEIKQIHFYDKAKDVAYMPVYSDAHRTKTFSMASQFLSLHKVFKGYEVLRDYADYRKVRVLNASSKSYIDALERVVINQPLSQAAGDPSN
ncbi:hypothetical protein [Spirosoma validum]|uniref:DUF115 domain-containing protein n=1 Tax=Spirosoma validum TaxID=2771355 RepID=A0A927GCZ1_9BACT|nr:hypothetical protein [Spirosoma validum]MBD2753128.1 hypothetical protein [Spirosoma validum]